MNLFSMASSKPLSFEYLPRTPSTDVNLKFLQRPEELGVLVGTKSALVLGNPFKLQFLSSVYFKGYKERIALFDPRQVMPIYVPDFEVDFDNLLKCLSAVLLSLKVEQNVVEAIAHAFSNISTDCRDLPLFQGCSSFTIDEEYVSMAETAIPRLLCCLTLQCVLRHGADDSKMKLEKLTQIILSAFIIYDIENVLPTGVPEMLPKNLSKLICVNAVLGIAMAVAKKFMGISSVYRDVLPHTIVELLMDSMKENRYSAQVNLTIPLTFRTESLFEYLEDGNSVDFFDYDSGLLPNNYRKFVDAEALETYSNAVPNYFPMDFPTKGFVKMQRKKSVTFGGDDLEINESASWCRSVDVSHDIVSTTKGLFYERSFKISPESQQDWTLPKTQHRQVTIVGDGAEDLEAYSIAQAVEENRHISYILSCLVLHCNPVMAIENIMKVVHEALQCRGKECPSGSNCKLADLLPGFSLDDHIRNYFQIIFVKNVAMLLNFGRRINLGSIRPANENVVHFGLVGYQYLEIADEGICGNTVNGKNDKFDSKEEAGK